MPTLAKTHCVLKYRWTQPSEVTVSLWVVAKCFSRPFGAKQVVDNIFLGFVSCRKHLSLAGAMTTGRVNQDRLKVVAS